MDDFPQISTCWGSGGDRLRLEGREVEAVLIAAERFDAVASLLGFAKGQEMDLETSWEKPLDCPKP